MMISIKWELRLGACDLELITWNYHLRALPVNYRLFLYYIFTFEFCIYHGCVSVFISPHLCVSVAGIRGM